MRTTNFTNEGVVDYSDVVTRIIKKKNIEDKYLRPGDIIIEKSGGSDKQPVGRVIYFDGPEHTYLFNNFTGLLRVSDQSAWFPKYVFYSLYGNYRRGGTRSFENKTTGLHNLKTDDYVSRYEVTEAEYGRQVEICNRLDKLYSIIKRREEELSMLDEFIKARFVELFGTVDNNVFDYPIVRLGDYAKLQGGYAFKSKDFVDEGIPLVQIGNVNKDYLDWEVINAVPEEYLDRYGEFSLCDGDLVMAMTRPIIKSLNSVKIAKVSKSDVPCLLNQRVGRFVLSDSLDKLFLETLCKSDDFKDYVERMSGNSLQPNISSKQVEDYMIILPPIDLQESFAEFVKQVDKSKVAVQKALDETQILLDSMMQEFFG